MQFSKNILKIAISTNNTLKDTQIKKIKLKEANKLNYEIIRIYFYNHIIFFVKVTMGGNQVSQQAQKSNMINHPKFSNPIFFKNQTTGEEFFRVSVPVVNEKEYENWVSSLKQINWESQALMLPTFYEFQKQGLCGSSGLVTMEFQNFPFLLNDQIGNRQSIGNKKFDENQLWYLLYTLISDACDFHKRRLGKVGDIRPENIFINEDGQVKLATQFSWPGELVNYAKTFHENQITYLSPEQIKDINFGKVQTKVQPSQSEAFSIGLTVLDAAQLSSSNRLYAKHGKFDYNMLSQKLAELQKDNSYSQLLIETITNLCEPDALNRSNCQEILQWLEPCQRQILNLDQFQIDRLPNKFRRKSPSQQHTQNIPRPPPIIHQNLPHQQVYQQSYPNSQYIPQRGTQVVYQRPQSQIIQGRPQEQIFPPPPQVRQQFQHNRIPSHPQQQIVYRQIPPGNILPHSISQGPIQHGSTIQNKNVVIHGTQNPNRIPQNMVSTQVIYRYSPQNKPVVNSQYINQGSPSNQRSSTNVIPSNNIIQTNNTKPQQRSSQNNSGQYSRTLDKIDQQLNISRKMFPS